MTSDAFILILQVTLLQQNESENGIRTKQEQNEFYDHIVSYLPTSYIKIPCKVGVIAQKVTEWMCFAELHIYSFSPLVGQMALI